MTKGNLDEFKAWEASLYATKEQIEERCRAFSSALQYCDAYMKDPQSQAFLQRGKDVIQKIRAVLDPIEKELVRVRKIIAIMEESDFAM